MTFDIDALVQQAQALGLSDKVAVGFEPDSKTLWFEADSPLRHGAGYAIKIAAHSIVALPADAFDRLDRIRMSKKGADAIVVTIQELKALQDQALQDAPESQTESFRQRFAMYSSCRAVDLKLGR